MGALIRETGNSENKANATDNIDIQKIEVNPYQPRTHFNQEALDELASSIKHLGIIQPITVRETENGQYQIISGERRYRASLLAGLTEIPAYIRHAEDNNMLEMALVENIQREDLDAIEIAISYQRLIDECRLTQEDVSERVGMKRSTIANYLRLLKLPAAIQLAIRQGQIGMGHARALINIKQEELQVQMLHNIIENELSVRQVETKVHEINNPSPEPEPEPMPETEPIPEHVAEAESEPATEAEPIQEPEHEPEQESFPEPETDIDVFENEEIVYHDPNPPFHVADIEEEKQIREMFSRRFGTKVEFKRDAKGAGRIVIPFRTDDELQYIIRLAEKIS